MEGIRNTVLYHVIHPFEAENLETKLFCTSHLVDERQSLGFGCSLFSSAILSLGTVDEGVRSVRQRHGDTGSQTMTLGPIYCNCRTALGEE